MFTVANLYIANLLIISQSAFSHFGLTICKSAVTILFVTLANLLRYERFHISYLPLVVSKSRTKHNSRSMNYFPCR